MEAEQQGSGLHPDSSAKQQEAGEKPSTKRALQKSCSCREASASPRTSSLLGGQQRILNAFPTEQLKHIPSPGAAESSIHPRTAEQDVGLAHLSLQHHGLRTAPGQREIKAFASENWGGLLCAGQPRFSPPKMPSTSSCPAVRPIQAGGDRKGKAPQHPPQPSSGSVCSTKQSVELCLAHRCCTVCVNVLFGWVLLFSQQTLSLSTVSSPGTVHG